MEEAPTTINDSVAGIVARVSLCFRDFALTLLLRAKMIMC